MTLRIKGYLWELPHDYLIQESEDGWRLECSCGARSRMKRDWISAVMSGDRHKLAVARAATRLAQH